MAASRVLCGPYRWLRSLYSPATPSAVDGEVKLDPPVQAPDRSLLRSHQRELHGLLGSLRPDLGSIYLAALTVWADGDQPHGAALASHCLRGLMDELPSATDVPWTANRQQLTPAVRNLEDEWSKASFEGTREWSGEIDDGLRGFLRRLDKFFTWFRQHYPRRKQEAREVLRTLDVTKRSLPEPLEEHNVNIWYEMRHYFTSLAHFNRLSSEGDFDRWLEAFERFLLDRLRPLTSEDLDEIDRLLEEANRDA